MPAPIAGTDGTDGSNRRTAIEAAAIAMRGGTATAVAGAATLNRHAGVITSEALTTAAGADYTLVLTNNTIAAADEVFCTVGNGSNTTANITVGSVTPAAGSVTVLIRNLHTGNALNGTIKIGFWVMKTQAAAL